MKKKNNHPVGVPKNIPTVKTKLPGSFAFTEEDLMNLISDLEKDGLLNTKEKLNQIIEKGLPDSIQELLNE